MIIKINKWYPVYGTLVGDVEDHPKLGAGHVHTSAIIRYDADEDVFITRSGSKYQLGEPHPEVADAQKAREALIANAASIQ